MRLCIPTTDDRGLEGRLSPHFGKAPFYTFVDVTEGRATAVANAHARHEHGRCEAPATMVSEGVAAVVCLGLGRRALAKLRAAGVPVYLTETRDVAGAVDAYRAGTLRLLEEEEACHGGAHGH